MTCEARIVSEAIDAPPDVVYEFARTMENLPRWASGLAAGVSQEGGEWFTDSPMGRVKVSMAPRNDFRVLDHEVRLPDGRTVHNAFRVTPAGGGQSCDVRRASLAGRDARGVRLRRGARGAGPQGAEGALGGAVALVSLSTSFIL